MTRAVAVLLILGAAGIALAVLGWIIAPALFPHAWLAAAFAGVPCSGFFGALCLQMDAEALPKLRTSKLAISRIRLALLIFPTFTISQPSTHVACTQHGYFF